MLNLNSIMIGTHEVTTLATFYEHVLGRPADMVDGDWYGWQVGSCFLSIGEHSEVGGQAKEPQRILFNFETADVRAEFARIKATGATVVKEPYNAGEGTEHEMWIATFCDPDGNYFQLMSPWEQ